MAITIITSPSGTPSVNDNMWHVVSSDNSNNTDFKFVFDIVINGDQKIRVKQFPNPTTGKAYFDAGPIVRNEMTYAWFEPINNAYVALPDMSGQVGIIYSLQVGEDFSGVTTLNMASGETSGFNWAPPLFKRRNISLNDKRDSWLTNRPLSANAALGENLFVGFHIYSNNGGLVFKVEKFNENNASDGGATDSIIITPPAGIAQMNIGTSAIEEYLGLTDFFDGVKYYDVWFNSFTNKFRVYLKCNPKYRCIPVHFLNRWGMWDTLRFDLASRLSMDVERKGFGRRDHEFTDTGVDYKSPYNRYYEGKINYSNKANWSYKLNANALTDAEYEWAAELFTSPQILLEIDGYYYPATIKKNNYDYMKYVNDKLKALEVEFEFNSERNTQLR